MNILQYLLLTSALEKTALVFGKLHVAIVHFPIALLVIASLLELLAWVKKTPNPTAYLLLRLGAISAVFAIAFGFLNAEFQEFYGELEDAFVNHRNSGILVGIVAVAALFLGSSEERRLKKPYRILTILAGLPVIISAHYGGKLVHGVDYYSEAFKDTPLEFFFAGSKAPTTINDPAAISKLEESFPPKLEEVSFETEVKPIFQETCGNCHLGGKDKGEYKMDSLELLLKGGESGVPAVIPGKSKESYLIHLVAALNPNKVMPNKGRKLTAEEVSVLRAWIDQGAKWEGSHELVQFTKARFEPRNIDAPDSSYPNPIDRFIDTYWKANSITPPKLLDDAKFYRKLSYDLIGLPPTPKELLEFLSNNEPDKREKLIDSLLSRNIDYAVHWLSYWNDLLRNGYTGPGFLHGGRKEFTGFLFKSLLENKPYDEFAKDLVTGEAGSSGFIKGILWWEKNEAVNPNEHPAMQAAQNVGQIFMGVNVKCASCHDSFTDAWKLEDAYGLANVYADFALEINECNRPTGEFTKARFLIPELGEIKSPLTNSLSETIASVKLQKIKDTAKLRGEIKAIQTAKKERMTKLASLMTSKDNGRFSRTIVNRYWAYFMGRGLVEPIDEMDTESWNQDLLDYLANYFVENNYDTKKLFKLIASSFVYQSISSPSKSKYEPNDLFYGPVVKRLSAEQFLDTLNYTAKRTPEISTEEGDRIVRLAQRNLKDLILFSHEFLNKDEPHEVKVDLNSAKSVILAVVPNHKVLSRLEALAKVHKEVAKSEQIRKSIDKTVGSSVDKREQLETLQEELGNKLEHAVWSGLVFERNGKPISIEPTHFVAENNDFSFGKTVVINEKKGEQGLSGLPAYFVEFNTEGADSLKALIGLDKRALEFESKYQFVILKDFPLRSAFLHDTELLNSLGRPKRDQVVTRRDSTPTVIEALTLTVNSDFNNLLEEIGKRNLSTKDLFLTLLSREPTEEEAKLAPNSDLIWSLVLLPEFQLL